MHLFNRLITFLSTYGYYGNILIRYVDINLVDKSAKFMLLKINAKFISFLALSQISNKISNKS